MHRNFKTIKQNVLALGLLQIAKYLVPLASIPYLVRVLGPEKYGLIAFSTALSAYVLMLSDYGFNLSATRDISINRNNPKHVANVYSSVTIIKMLILLALFFLLMLLVFMVDLFRSYWLLHLLSFFSVVLQSFYPLWLFQGLEQLKTAVKIQLVSRVTFLVCIFLFVKSSEQYLLVPIFSIVSGMVLVSISLYVVRYKLKICYLVPNFYDIRSNLREGWTIFVSSLSINIYTVTTTVVLGFFTNYTIVGYYTAAEKIITALKGLYNPLSQALYPAVSLQMVHDKKETLRLVNKVALLTAAGMFLICLLVFLFSEQIVELVFGSEYEATTLILQIMSPIPVCIVFSNVFGFQLMLNLGLKREFTKVVSFAAILGFASNVFLIQKFGALGSATTVLLVELCLPIALFYVLKAKLDYKLKF